MNRLKRRLKLLDIYWKNEGDMEEELQAVLRMLSLCFGCIWFSGWRLDGITADSRRLSEALL